MGACTSTHGLPADDPYVEIPLEPRDDLVIVPHADLEAMRTTPPTRLIDGSMYYKSARHIVLYNDKERKIVRVFKNKEVYLCPTCGLKAKPQFVSKDVYSPENFIVKNGASHFHSRTNLRIPCICPQGHVSHHFYGNQCECGWPMYYLNQQVGQSLSRLK